MQLNDEQVESKPTYAMEGTVASFDDSKGYGWIARDGGPDVFVHFTQIRGMGKQRRQLFPGWRVSFELGDAGRGPMALNVHVLDQEHSA